MLIFLLPNIRDYNLDYKQLLDEVFVISRIIKVEVLRGDLHVITETLIILNITNTESNNCFITH